MGNQQENKAQQDNSEKKESKNALEWSVFSLSLLLLCGVFAYLGYHTYQYESSPPDLEVALLPAPSPNAPYRYHVVVYNTGGSTAEEAQLEFLLKQNSVVLDKAQLSIPWVPQSSKREGWIIFSVNPAKADTVIASVLGYKRP